MSRRTDGGGETEAETPESVDGLENANLLESTQIATLFLDRNLALKNFTPAAKDLFHLIESDVGRPITHIRVRFDADTSPPSARSPPACCATPPPSTVSPTPCSVA